ncbi:MULTISPECIES: phosphoenolpyruvate--protein phosphotransferase [Gammaproteobacteria]|uniref:phosphoenolpyruvate--protein phosphotransferase n=1 Tax=Gammaproteobacteria TaxID=1236 RepID=UPI000DD047D9|nr:MULTISPECIES: phosphoenolpyruvate--protein phosphotransferase [Gammaproteobacteria]RTE86232.1 phosphoenolpyruvate--protein phosphotransferase [Aliidiomarina sp. B3213]TCZ91583.1 phosphoenolpyruvate--protein phosphotransferase [Lysobacter sp. N42]
MLITLQRIVESVNQAPEFDVALNTMVRSVKAALGSDVCSVYLADPEQREFVLMASDGLTIPKGKRITLAYGEGLISLAAQREEPLNLANATTHPNFKLVKEVNETAYRAMLVAPIIHQRKVLGVLAVQQVEARAFTGEEESFVVTLAAQLAAVIAHAEAKGLIADPQSPWLKKLKAIPGAPGVALGEPYVGRPIASLRSIVPRRTETPWREIHRFRKAVLLTRQELKRLAEQVADYVADDTLAIFDVYQGLLDATSLGNAVEEKIKEGWRAQTAVKMAVDGFVSQFEDLDDAYLRERAVDVRDLGERILGHLKDRKKIHNEIPDSCILVAEEVTASMLAEIPRNRLQGLISLRGSANSHAAIMARSMGIAAVFGIEDVPLSYFEEQYLIVDGYSGEIFVNPPSQVVAEYQNLQLEEQELSETVAQHRHKKAETKDGLAISLQINAGLNVDHGKLCGEHQGIGLYRTEIPFMMRERFPTESEQYDLYREVFEHYPKVPVVMRTLDVGGDKPLPYFPISEENPFLGWRGIRMTLDHPEIFLVQVRAMIRANIGYDNLKILLPMITSVEEVDEAARLINQAYFEVRNEWVQQHPKSTVNRPELGVMIEVPAVLYQLEAIARRVDFFSVGTNDLTQYMLAVDRNNPRVAQLYEAYHPAVLNALQDIVETCQKLGKPVSVCGELAGDPGGAILLLSMGYRTLSMSEHNLDKIRWIVRNLESKVLQVILTQALNAKHPDQVRKVLTMKLESLGLGGFVRAGK